MSGNDLSVGSSVVILGSVVGELIGDLESVNELDDLESIDEMLDLGSKDEKDDLESIGEMLDFGSLSLVEKWRTGLELASRKRHLERMDGVNSLMVSLHCP